MTTTLNLTGGKVNVRQDPEDPTTVTVSVVDEAGDPFTLGSDWTDAEGLFTVDNTDRATGVIVLDADGQDAGVYPFRVRDADDFTWLMGELIVGPIGVPDSMTGARSSALTVTIDEGGVTVQVAVGAPPPTASGVSFDPSGLAVVTGLNVQDAIAELDAAQAAASASFEQAVFGPKTTTDVHLIPGVYVAAPSAMLASRVYLCGVLTLNQAKTLDELSAGVTGAGDGASVVRFGIAPVVNNNSEGQTLTALGSINGTSATIQTISAIATVLTPGVYAILALTNGQSATAPTLRSHIPISGHHVAGTGALANSPVVVSSASHAGAFPATVPTFTGNVAAAPQVAVKFSA